jgi:hypothetical protein
VAELLGDDRIVVQGFSARLMTVLVMAGAR